MESPSLSMPTDLLQRVRRASRDGLRSFLAAAGTFGTLVLLSPWAGEPLGVYVLGVVVAFSLDRVGKGQERAVLLVALPVVTAGVAAVGGLMRAEPPLGSALFVGLVFLSVHLRRYGPRASAAGRLMTLPLLAMFVSPVPVGDSARGTLVWSVVACLVAVAWHWGVSALVRGERAAAVPPPPPASGSSHTKLALQAAIALGLAFTAGHLLFPAHWSWTVVTALVVTIGARSRGHVLHKGVQRFGGALVGAVSATLIAGPLHDHPVASAVVIFAYLLAGLVLRQIDYAYWSFAVTSMLAVLYGLLGQAGPEFLAERLVEILLGTACGIVPAFLVLPIRTEAVVRRNLAHTLHALGDLLREPGAEHEQVLHQRAEGLRTAAEPLLARHRLSRLLARRTGRIFTRRPGLDASPRRARGELAEGVRGLLAGMERLDAGATPAPARAALRRNIGTVRLTLARRPAPDLVPVQAGQDPALTDLDAALRAVHAGLPAVPETPG
ncbi:FUSC family protein [Sphaerisporangium aureirubrum]|uniref:FUSC family protein n=1 Tax=Sphaerisporangium aureirubrum TaxID=1544736 RepID=A0ABW1NKQ0_9ACTN